MVGEVSLQYFVFLSSPLFIHLLSSIGECDFRCWWRDVRVWSLNLLEVFLVNPFNICWIPLPLESQSLLLCGGLIFQIKLSSFLGKFYWVVYSNFEEAALVLLSHSLSVQALTLINHQNLLFFF